MYYYTKLLTIEMHGATMRFINIVFMCRQFVIKYFCTYVQPIPVTGRSKAWVCSCSFAGIGGSNLARFHGYISLVNVVCCQVEVPASS